ncbi:MAG: protein-glutamate O-methyltransferase CheR [Alphaproteobacteria bacterium]|nr:protein-glutamate O-methyltransferase CheR [Alphaproteobacteria bacterium]
MTPAAFAAVAALVRARSGLVLTTDKAYLVESRLAPIARREGLADVVALAERLGQPGSEGLMAAVVEAMTTNETFFFRDAKPFEHLRRMAVPALHAARAPSQPLRIWSAASSSGQEVYSIAIVMAELAPALGGRPVEILATDISGEMVARTQAGLYTQFEVQRGLPVQKLIKWFRKDGERWRVTDSLRAMVQARCWNLLDDPAPLGRFDIVFCRNVLIYFDQPTKARVLERIARALAPDGALYLGGAESVIGLTAAVEAVAGEAGVYAVARRPSSAPAAVAPVGVGAGRRPEAIAASRSAAAAPAPVPGKAPVLAVSGMSRRT